MMRWLVQTALELRVAVLALATLLIIVGVRLAPTLPLDVFPEFAPPYVEIQTEAPGLSAEEVEALVTVPLENSLNGTAGLKTIRSKSVLGLSSIVMILAEGANVDRTRQLIQERLAVEAPRLPTIARQPVILQPLSTLSRTMMIGATSTTLSQRDLSVVALWTIRPRLMAVPGVVNVAIWGQRDKQFQVLVDPDRLRANQVTLDQIVKAAQDAVALDGGGFLDTPNQRLAVRQRPAVVDAVDLGRIVVSHTAGATVRMGDVANVQIGSPAPIGDAIINDVPGLLLIVEKQPNANLLEVTRQVEAALESLKPGLTGIELDAKIFRPATFIERAIDNLNHAMITGCLLVVLVLIVFLYDWRTALISITAIPLSIVATVVVLSWWGLTINTMIIAGLVIALGEVVDDAIIDVENIVRRLRLNRLVDKPRPAFDVVLDASLEVRSAVVFATLIVILVFIPVFFLEGLAGAFFRPLAIGYVLAILASLIVALVVTPALSLMILPGDRGLSHEPPLARWLKGPYTRALEGLLRQPWGAIVFLILAFAGTGFLVTRLGQEFLPDFQETDFLMHFVEKPGTSIESMRRVTALASKELRAIPGVNHFGSHIGRAEVADEVVGPNFTELWISIDPDVDYASTVARVQKTVDAYPGLYRDLLTFLRERTKEVLTGSSASIVVRIYGPDLARLRAKAQEVYAVMGKVNGAVNLKVEPQVLVAQVEVRSRPEALAQFGLTPGQVRKAVTTLVRGLKVGEIYQDQKKFDVVVWGVPEVRADLDALRNLRIDIPGGAHVPLKDVADVRIVPAANEVKREGASRRIDVVCDAKGRDLGSVARDVEAAVRTLTFDQEYHPEFLGEYTHRQESQTRLLGLTGLAFLGILLLLYIDFKSLRLTLLVALTIPFALIGGVAGIALVGGSVSIGSLVGFVTVLGIAARNGIMLVSHYRHLHEVEGEPFGLPLVVRGAQERLLPILMTASATGLALLPLAITGNKPGQEIEYPLAVVILGGLITSTLLNLFLLPPLYSLFGETKTPAPL